MTGYTQINLQDLLNEIGEDRTKSILSDFCCPLNADVEDFLKNKAKHFSIQGLSKTYLVFASYKDNPVLVGYYTLAMKYFHVSKSALSSNLRKKISKFAQCDDNIKKHIVIAPLIAQLGKNFNNNYNHLITGDELLKIACNKISEIQSSIGSKIAYLECEDKECLKSFYESNGFVNFGKRLLDRDETDKMDGKYLIQMLRYFDGV